MVPSALERMNEIAARTRGKKVAVFLDYDGTLSPIVSRPEMATMSDQMRETVRRLASKVTVAVVSGRDLPDVRQRVGLENIFYAGSHGFDIAGPGADATSHRQGSEFLATLDAAERALRELLQFVPGSLVERKKLSIAVHYRNVAEENVAAVERAVEEVHRSHPDLRKNLGKKIFELQPAIDWDKGKAVLWLLEKFGLAGDNVLPFYLGDDVTDEDAFRDLRTRGIGVAVMDKPRETKAHYALRDPGEVQAFLERLGAEVSSR